MNTLFILLFLLSTAGLALGLIKPRWVKTPSRKRAATIFGGAVIVFFVLVGITSPATPASTAKPVAAVPAATTTTPVATTTAPVATATAPTKKVDVTPQVTKILTDSTDSLASLFAQGKQILGTTQYSSAYEGIAAIQNDPNSAGALFGKFRTDNCIKTAIDLKSYGAYRDASNLYYSANIDQPNALDNWNSDMENTVTDFCTWAGDAVSWQIREISDAKLHADESKVDADLASARTDIKALSN